MNYWQIASGSNGRDYSNIFLRYGIACAGGETPISRMSQVKVGDRVILKRGMREILAVGEVVERSGYLGGIRDAAGKLSEQPYAYLSLIRPTRRYPLDPQNVAGALEVLKLLLPNGGQA